MLLPYYDVFDEQRYFAPAARQRLCHLNGAPVALTICEDAWNDKSFWENRLYNVDPVEELMKQGASLILNISASPWWQNKRALRREMLAAIAKRHHVPVVMVNQVGGDDSLIFDGSSLAIGPDGEVIAQGKSFEEDLIFADLAALTGDVREQPGGEDEAMLEALALGTRDYVHKCGFSKVVITHRPVRLTTAASWRTISESVTKWSASMRFSRASITLWSRCLRGAGRTSPKRTYSRAYAARC